MKKSYLFVVILFSAFSSFSSAGLDILSHGQIRKLIGDFPAVGSLSEAKDDETLLELQATRTKKDCDYAASQSKLNLERVFVKPIGPLEDDEYDSLKFKLLKLQAKMLANTVRAKSLYDRPRPYVRNTAIKPCISLESSSSYPSGHSAMGRAIGKFLADRYPDRAEEIMIVADQVGMNRMVGGVHHPSDVVAGRKLGDEIALRTILDRD